MRSKFLKNGKGTTIVEMALILPVLCLLIFGMVDFALLLYDKAMITNASREGARLGVVYRVSGPGAYSPPTNAEITSRVHQYLQDTSGSGLLISFPGASSTVNVVPNDGCQTIGSGNPLLVTVTFTYKFLMLRNFLPGLVNPFNIQGNTSMVCE